MSSTHPTTDPFLYDAHLTAIDHPNKTLVFSVVRGTHRVKVDTTAYWTLGTVGRLRLPAPNQSFAFHAYVDPLLRRAPGLDDHEQNRWGWRCGERRFTVKAGLLPGKGGAVVPDETEALELRLPLELRALCACCGVSPQTLLRGFVADLCGLMNFCACPREDDYSSNGSAERDLAKQYFLRAYGWLIDQTEFEPVDGLITRPSSHV